MDPARAERAARTLHDEMCLIAIAHRPGAVFPLIVAANRDEDYDRPTVPAHFWEDAPYVIGGRDVLHGGSWLAITRRGRLAAVTNLRGSEKPPQGRSRGELVGGFVTTSRAPILYSQSVAAEARQFAGFHLFAGQAGEALTQVSAGIARELEPGIHALSNAPAGETWPKVAAAERAMSEALEDRSAGSVMTRLLKFLGAHNGLPLEEEVFVVGNRYGTRSSAVIVYGEGDAYFAEQLWSEGGVAASAPKVFRFSTVH